MLRQRQSGASVATAITDGSHSIAFADILNKCGDFGRYQLMLLTLFGLINVLVAMHYFAQTMISFEPKHWCYHEKLENMSYREIEDLYKKFELSVCTKLEDIKDNGTESQIILSKDPCERWIYELDYNYKSMTADLNWICENEFKSSVGQSWFFVGSVIGTLFYGFLSDKIGRVPALIFSNLSGFVGDFSTIFALEVWSFSICRFISGLAADTNVYIMYIIVLEYISPKMRTLGLNLMVGVFTCIGLVISPWLAVATGYWKYFLLCTSMPILLVIGFYFIVQESAQWLVTQNDVEGAIRRLRNVAIFNRRIVDEADFDEFRQHCETEQRRNQSQKKANLFDIFRMPRMRKNTLILFFKSMIITLCYDVASRNVERMGISPFTMFTISALGVLPASLVLICLQDHIGRKGMAAGSMLFAGIVTGSTGIVLWACMENQIPQAVMVVLVTVTRFCVAVSFEAGSQYATELIPTCVRGQGLAAVHVAGFAVLFLVPYIIYLGKYFRPAPSLLMCVLFLCGAFVVLLLPETLNKSLPKTIEEGEEFGKGETLCSFVCCVK